MQFNVFGNGIRYVPNMKNCSVYHWNQNRNKADNKCSSLQQMYLFICLALFVCVKDMKCLRMAIPIYCFNIFGLIFGLLFCLHIKNLILGCKDLAKYEKVSVSSLMCENISSYGKRRSISFLKIAHWYGLNFLDISFLLDLKI